MIDKVDPPNIPEGYALSMAFLCMLDVVRCVQGLVEVPDDDVKAESPEKEQPQEGATKEESTGNISLC